MPSAGGEFVMGEEKLLINYLKESIDRLADKFDDFLKVSSERDIKQRELESKLQDHTTRITNLEMPNQKKLQERYPIFYKVAETLVLVGITILCMHLFPPAVKLLTALL